MFLLYTWYCKKIYPRWSNFVTSVPVNCFRILLSNMYLYTRTHGWLAISIVLITEYKEAGFVVFIEAYTSRKV